MDGMDRAERTNGLNDPPERSTPTGYFIAILAVLGGTLLMPPFFLVFTLIGALLLLVLIAALLIYKARRGQKRGMGKILSRGRARLQMHRHGFPSVEVRRRGQIYRTPGGATPRSR